MRSRVRSRVAKLLGYCMNILVALGAGIVDAVQSRIHNPDETTFVCVCIPEVGLKPFV